MDLVGRLVSKVNACKKVAQFIAAGAGVSERFLCSRIWKEEVREIEGAKKEGAKN